MRNQKEKIKVGQIDFGEKVVAIDRVSKVVEGGRTPRSRALVVVFNPEKRIVGFGTGKSKETSPAIRKASHDARKNLIKVPMQRGTIPHKVVGKFQGAKVMLRPASPGTGVIAGAGVRIVLESVGIQNILAKSLGSNNPHNLVRATFVALKQLWDPLMVARRRGISLDKVFNG
ncbi:MAG: 30S ribosomal protein S5 [Bacteroidota bacterium]